MLNKSDFKFSGVHFLAFYAAKIIRFYVNLCSFANFVKLLLPLCERIQCWDRIPVKGLLKMFLDTIDYDKL